jgi:glycosyltransferase involved in cell wall biosynthesis
MKPQISVVIPAHNEADTIEHCLDQLLKQRSHDVELIVVDNNSTDGTAQRARQFPCRVIQEPRPGVSCARQTGFDAAEGHIIASTDADTLVDTDWLWQIGSVFEENPSLAGVYGPVHLAPTNKLRTSLDKAFLQFLEWNQRLRRPHFCGANFAVNRFAFQETGGFRSSRNGDYHQRAEDVQLALKLRTLGSVQFNKEMVVYTSARSISGRYLWSNTKTYCQVVWLGMER